MVYNSISNTTFPLVGLGFTITNTAKVFNACTILNCPLAQNTVKILVKIIKASYVYTYAIVMNPEGTSPLLTSGIMNAARPPNRRSFPIPPDEMHLLENNSLNLLSSS